MLKDKTHKEILILFKNYNYQIFKYSKNEIIALENSPCLKIGIILSGNIDITRDSNVNANIHLTSFSNGDIFGEVIAFSNVNKYPATVISKTNSEILFISKNDFINFCMNNPIILEKLLNNLTNKIIKLNNSISLLSLNTIRQKVCNYILNQYNENKNLTIKITITKQKISEILGIPRPSLSRELINLKKLKVINYSKNHIEILNLELLKSFI